jgi:hypothetical protein
MPKNNRILYPSNRHIEIPKTVRLVSTESVASTGLTFAQTFGTSLQNIQEVDFHFSEDLLAAQYRLGVI